MLITFLLPDRTVDDIPTKLFIGRLPNGTTAEDLKDCFSEYGPFKDVYVPNNFRNFGFITFQSQHIANEVLKETHLIGGKWFGEGPILEYIGLTRATTYGKTKEI